MSLDEETVEVDEELRFVWHRPPLEEVERQWNEPQAVRIFVNGCFDLMHVGHFNALRQAKSLFRSRGFRKVTLVAGIHSDAAITRQKGAPLLTEEERVAVLRATKWVDELVTDLPYVSMSARMADALRVHWICHGDDLPVCKGGGGMYSDAIENGRFQLLKRTEGISTTHILERLLRRGGDPAGSAAASCGSRGGDAAVALESAPATTQRLRQFADPADPHSSASNISNAKRVVYVSGDFDLLHAGHVEFLNTAARHGDFLLVGVCSDETVRQRTGCPPVLTLLERAMALLSLRPVGDVVLGAPWEASHELLATLNVSVVVVDRPTGRGRKRCAAGSDKLGCSGDGASAAVPGHGVEEVAVSVVSPVTEEAIKQRVLERRGSLLERNGELMQKELAYIERKQYVPEA